MLQVSDAMRYLHSKDIIHRDLYEYTIFVDFCSLDFLEALDKIIRVH